MPALAESWEFTGPLTMEFTLRQGVKFHNGADFTAADVVETLNTVITPEYGTRYSISVDWIDNVEMLGDYKVRINMSKPFAGAVEMLADALPIYPHEFFAENGSAGIAATPIGTGPYKLVSQEPGIRYEMERFEDYYAGSPKGGATIDKITVRTIPEMNTQYAELMSGSLDWIWRIPPGSGVASGRPGSNHQRADHAHRICGFCSRSDGRRHADCRQEGTSGANPCHQPRRDCRSFRGRRLRGAEYPLQPGPIRVRAGRCGL